MNLKNILIVLLVIISGVMIYLGVKANMKPPILTGVGFLLIAAMFGLKNKH